MKPKKKLTPPIPVQLTDKQDFVCAMLCGGHSDRTIAEKMKITIPGVRRHLITLTNKFNTYGRTGIAVAYDRQRRKKHHS